jgi:SAM-dependent methyltransferase
MSNAAAHWDRLHENPRFRPSYPNENVVRFLISNGRALGQSTRRRFLDIGVGAGRHLKLANELGFEVYGIDLSLIGLQCASERLSGLGIDYYLAQAPMGALPFATSSFNIVLSYGVFYYGTGDEIKKSIGEAHRVLANTGQLFVVLRTTQDYRFGKGEQLERNTFRLKVTDTNEYDTVQHFLSEEDIPEYFAAFAEVSYEKTETTFANHSRVNSDWLITAQK